MNCKDCKFYDPCVEYSRITAVSVNPEHDDLETAGYYNPNRLKSLLEDDWYSETYKDFKEEKQLLGECNRGKLIYRIEFGVTDALFVQDAEDYSASCVVGPDFGCVHFEHKSGKLSTDSPEVQMLIDAGR